MRFAIVVLLSVFVCCFDVAGQPDKRTEKTTLGGSVVDYQIALNDVQTDVSTGVSHRLIYVLLDPRSFSEANLRKIFNVLSKKHARPQTLTVHLETNRKYLPDPDGDGTSHAESSLPNDPDRHKFHWALYFRTELLEVFRFNPILTHGNMKSIVLKGKDIGEN